MVDPGGMQEDPEGMHGHLRVSCACNKMSLKYLSSNIMNRVRLEKDGLTESGDTRRELWSRPRVVTQQEYVPPEHVCGWAAAWATLRLRSSSRSGTEGST